MQHNQSSPRLPRMRDPSPRHQLMPPKGLEWSDALAPLPAGGDQQPVPVSPRLRTGRVPGLPPGRKPEQRSKRMSDILADASESPRGLGGDSLSDRDIVVQECASGYLSMPSSTIDYRDVLKVIDARERSLQNIKTFLASMCFIRGNARSLPPGVLRRGRAKLARLLARHRVHSAVVVELIVKWRQRHGLALGFGAAPSDLMLPPEDHGGGGSGGRSGGGRSGTASGTASPGGGGDQSSMEDKVKYYLPSGLAGQPVSRTMATAMAVASKRGPPPAPKHRMKEVKEPGEPFLWMGVNYLHKMRHDMKYAPLPTSSDPLLLSWFHFDVDPNYLERVDSFRNPSFLTSEVSDMGNSREWVEQEWWFDAERLHSQSDLSRMREAAQVVLDEVQIKERREGAVSIETMIDANVLNKPGNDIGREMEVLLYGRDGGFAAKIAALAEQTASVVQIQCLYGSFSLVRRVRRRREARVLVAAVYIQKLYRRRLGAFLSDQANRLAMAAQQHRENYIRERDKRMAAETEQQRARERTAQRNLVIKRRWLAVKTAVQALLERKRAATRVQCAHRARKAREEYFHKTLEKRSRIRELKQAQMEGQEIEPKAKLIQSRVRAHRAATQLLTDQYDQRTQWYNDSRTAVMLGPVSKHITAKRRELQVTLRVLDPRLARLSGVPHDLLQAQRRLWSLQGEVAVLEQLMGHASIDVLMKRRLEFKLALQTSYITLDRTKETYAEVHADYLQQVAACHRLRGSLEVMEQLQGASETVTVLTAGHVEALRRKLSMLEMKLEAANKADTAARNAYHNALRNERGASNALAICSSFLSRHATAAPIKKSADGEVIQGSDYISQPHEIPKSTFQPMLVQKRRMATNAEAEVGRLGKEAETREALQVVCAWARGGLVTLDSIHASTFRGKLDRLERRRAEALGNAIATANAKIAYRVCKQSMAELAGSKELLATLERQQQTMPCAQLELVLALPNTAKVEDSLCLKTLEDIATWMGVSDDRFVLASWEVRPADEENTGKGGKLNLVIMVNLHKQLQQADGSGGNGESSSPTDELDATPSAEVPPAFNPEPIDLGEAVVTEWLEGRLAGGLTATAELLGIAKLPIENVSLRVPAREELAAHMPTLEATIDESGYELQSTIT